MKSRLLYFLIFALSSAGLVSALGEGQYHVIASPSTDPKIGKFDVTIKVLDESGKLIRHTIDVSASRGAKDAGCFTLLARKGRETRQLKLTLINATDTQINLRPELPKNSTAYSYSLVMQAGCVQLTPLARNNLAAPFENVELPQSPEDVKRNLQFLSPYPTTNLALKQGDRTGAFSAELHYSHALDSSYDTLVHAGLTADGSILRSEESHYLNEIEGEVGGYWTHNIAPSGLIEVGIASKLQSDRDFDVIDQTFGVNAWTWVPWFDNIARHLFLTGDSTRPSFQAQPLFILGYDYVLHEKRDAPSNSAYDGENRFDGRLYWPIPLARQLPLLVVNRKFGVDLIVDIGGIVDLDRGNFAPETKLSIDFLLEDNTGATYSGSNSRHGKAPSVTLSFVNGRVAPRFENVNAFLAGLKYDF